MFYISYYFQFLGMKNNKKLTSSFLKIVFALMILITIFSKSLYASTKELENAIFEIISFKDPMYIRIDIRKSYVEALLNYWNNFDDRIPNLSPLEDEWLRAELNGEAERITRALNSKEYALFSLSLTVEQCLDSLSKLKISYMDPVKEPTEMFLWLGVVKCYSEMSSVMSELHRAGLSNGRHDGAFYAVGSSLITDFLLDRVIPSAMADVMGWDLIED